VLAALAALGLMVAIFYFGLLERSSEAVLTEVSIPPGHQYVINGRVIAYLTDTALVTYNTDARRRPQAEHTLQTLPTGFDLLTPIENKSIQFAAFSGSSLQIFGQSTLQLNGEIADLRCGKSHVAVLRRNTSRGNDSIVVFNASGNEISDTPDYSDGQVVDFGFYVSDSVGSEHELLWVIVVSLRASKPVYTVKWFEYAGSGTTSYLPPFYDQAVERLYITDDSVFVIGTQDIFRYPILGGRGREAYRVGIYGQRVADMMETDAGVSFLLIPRQDPQNQTLRILNVSESDESGESLVTVHLQEPFIAALFSDSVLQVYSLTKLLTFNMNGRQILDMELTQVPLRVHKLDGGEFVLFETAAACYLASIQ